MVGFAFNSVQVFEPFWDRNKHTLKLKIKTKNIQTWLTNYFPELFGQKTSIPFGFQNYFMINPLRLMFKMAWISEHCFIMIVNFQANKWLAEVYSPSVNSTQKEAIVPIPRHLNHLLRFSLCDVLIMKTPGNKCIFWRCKCSN